MDEADRYAQGMRNRRAMLGDAYVDRTLAGRNDFNAPFQDLITRLAWGEIWERPGLTRATRSILTLGLMVARGHDAELRLHLRAALVNGVTRDEIRETLLHCAVYCGLPAANAAMHAAEAVFAMVDAETGAP